MTWEVLKADCLDAMREMDEASVDAIVTDPPYGLEFMGKQWDRLEGGEDVRQPFRGEVQTPDNPYGRTPVRYPYNASAKMAQEWHQAWATEALRVLKPGGHLLAFGGTRTYHRLACAVEDAGFEIRDSVIWLYGSGFPKSLDVSKAIDRAAGAEREVVGKYAHPATGKAHGDFRTDNDRSSYGDFSMCEDTRNLTAPATPEAQRWEGFGTALKPSHEPVVVARKPLIGTVAQNCLEFGTGALNIDGCRIGVDPKERGGFRTGTYSYTDNSGNTTWDNDALGEYTKEQHPAGRWPANVTLSHRAGGDWNRVMEELVVALAEIERGAPLEDPGVPYDHATLRAIAAHALDCCHRNGGGCEPVGTRRVKSGTAVNRNRPKERSRYDASSYEIRLGPGEDATYADPDGYEEVVEWRCAEGCAVAELDRQSGERPGMASQRDLQETPSAYFGADKHPGYREGFNDTGGASRFFVTFEATDFYGQQVLGARLDARQEGQVEGSDDIRRGVGDVSARFRYIAKASRAERNAGLEGFEERDAPWLHDDGRAQPKPLSDPRMDREQERRPTKNGHPTVKPIALMRWLCRLVTPPGGVCLDPFAGSGTTGCAAVLEGFDFIGIEREAEYVEIARARIAWWEQHRGREADEVLALSAKSERVRAEHEGAGQLGLEI